MKKTERRYIVDGNNPGRVYATGRFNELMEYLEDEGRYPFEIPKDMAIKLVFEGTDLIFGHEYWQLEVCDWFQSKSDREHEDKLEKELYKANKFAGYELLTHEDYDEPPIRKSKKLKGGGWIPLVNRRVA
jgi:hypothetical protein